MPIVIVSLPKDKRFADWLKVQLMKSEYDVVIDDIESPQKNLEQISQNGFSRYHCDIP